MIFLSPDQFSVSPRYFPEKDSVALIVFMLGCSLKCQGCNSTYRAIPSQGIDFQQAFRVIKEGADTFGVKNIVFTGGEPFNSDLLEFPSVVSNLEKAGYKTCIWTGYEVEDIRHLYSYLDEASNGHLRKPTYLKAGGYDETQRERKWGNWDSAKYILPTKNQKFYRFIRHRYGEGGNFFPMSDTNILDYSKENKAEWEDH